MTNTIRCIIVDDEKMAREVLLAHLGKIDAVDIIAQCKSAQEALKVIESQPVDLVFLDIEMPQINGITLAKTIGNRTKVVFTTAYRDYAFDGFELQAFDYLLKPISFDRIYQTIFKFKQQWQIGLESSQNTSKDHLFVRADRKMVRVDFLDILYIESVGDYLKIICKNQTVVTRESISQLEQKLPAQDFIRTHRSFIVALKQIVSFTNEFVEIGKKSIPISRSHKNAVLNKLDS